MLERIAIAVALIGLGALAYYLLVSAQRRSATIAAQHGGPLGQPALLVFTSPTCAPCKLQQMPIVDRLMAGWRDRVELRVIDVCEQPDVAAQFGVWSLPTTIVLDGAGRIEAINQGVASERKLREQIERVSGWATDQRIATNQRINESANQPTNQLAN
jgi:thioredoxin 1